jgi:hypothetical protein
MGIFDLLSNGSGGGRKNGIQAAFIGIRGLAFSFFSRPTIFGEWNVSWKLVPSIVLWARSETVGSAGTIDAGLRT